MVSCDECRKWFHFACVGVTEAIADYEWSCQRCHNARNSVQAMATAATTSISNMLPPVSAVSQPAVSSVVHNPQGVFNAASSMPTSLSLNQALLLPSSSGGGHDDPTRTYTSFVSIPLNDPLTTTAPSTLPLYAAPAPPPQTMNSTSDSLLRQNLVSQLPSELQLRFLEEEQALEMKHLLQRYQLLVDRTPPPITSIFPTATQTGGAVTSAEQCRLFSAHQPRMATVSLPPAPVLPNPQYHSSPVFNPQSSSRPPRGGICFQSHPSPVQNRANQDIPLANPLQWTGFGNDSTMLNRSQIAARQAVSKELPEYNGDPEQWPLFYGTLESTTRICGYTAEENMMRLQKCLKGKALEAVRYQLLHPGNLDSVIATLKMLFGRPEIIVHSLVQKIHSLPAPKPDKLNTLIDFAIAVRNMVATVQNCNLDEHLCNISLLQSLVDRLPPMIRLNWATHRQGLFRVTLTEFSTWLYTLAEAASTVTILQIQNDQEKARRVRRDDGFLNTHTETNLKSREFKPKLTASSSGCIICQGGCESVGDCKQFLILDHPSRWNLVREYRLCRSCLAKHQGPCKSTRTCGKYGCTFKHHRLLHNDAKDNRSMIPATSTAASCQESESNHAEHSDAAHNCNTHQANSKPVLFQYVPVTLHNRGIKIRTYAFLDLGSSVTLLEEKLASELRLEGQNYPLCLRWTGDACRYEDSAKIVALDVSGPRAESSKHRLAEVFTVKELQLPHQSLSFKDLATKYDHLQGIPVESYSDVQPRILIGMNNARLVHPLESREGAEHEPIAAKTRLGWMVFGTCSSGGRSSSTSIPHSFHVCHHVNDVELNTAVKNYFALENLGVSKPERLLLSSEDERAMKMMRSVTTFDNGRYCTGLLWKYDDVKLPDSKPMALRRHTCLMKRMQRDSDLAATLTNKMDEYMEKGYVRKISPEEQQNPGGRVWYLPMFPVYNPNKPNKVRIVWDAAATTAGTSLNDVLMKGPDQLNALPFVLYRFREKRIAISGDIAEMFLRIRMNENDQQCQRIFWCSQDGTIGEYIVTVMTFGAKCSPSCAQFVVKENATRFQSEFPEAVEVIEKGHYVDDMLASVDTEEDAIKLARDVRHIHQQGGFMMRNWISNSPKVVQALGETVTTEKNLDVNKEAILEKVLGMWWDTKSDTFRYKLSTERNQQLLTGQKHPTKRDVLRILMSVYDPLGLLSNYMILLKLLFQEIWREGISWDDEIGERQMEKWNHWLGLLPAAESVRIPRCYHQSPSRGTERTVEIHTFVDASELGYAAVCYFRFTEGEQISCSLVGSKSRVAPIKFVSIPRLELQAAVVGSRLAKSIEEGHSIKITRRYFWTDARDVMCWLKSDHRKYSQFVAFRVGEILEATELSEWQWLPGKTNVADEGTKWNGHPSFDVQSRWYSGPPFLSRPKEDWPSTSFNQETVEELRPTLLHHYINEGNDMLRPENYSNWNRLQRMSALVLRFPANIRRKMKDVPLLRGPLTSEELAEAQTFLYKRAQWECYGIEMTTLSRHENPIGKSTLPRTNSLYKLSPSLDITGLLRIHSRIDACDFAGENTQFPIVLPRSHPLTKLVLQDIHEKYHHQCNETFVNEVRRKFYIPKVRVECNRVRRECQRCKIRRAKPDPPMMANLPKERLAAYVRPFSYVGVDYFGPYQVTVRRRPEKRWGVLVTCLTTRAIHIEIANSLSTDSCIMALNNCFGRRGTPIQIISDRGTNFVGASKELKEAQALIDNHKLASEFTTPSTTWRFNPPASPHMGGSWERLIQTVKRILSEMKLNHSPTDEVLRSSMIKIENIVNSRPLTHVPIDDESSPALTPNHFLVGSSNGSKPLVPYSDSAKAVKHSWQTSDILANYFWKRWVNEYAPEITRRTKWFSPAKPIAVGDVVIIVDSAFPRNCWPKGRVIAINTSKDGQVRSATVQTITGIYERPVVKLAVLDIAGNGSMLDQGPPAGGDCCEHPSSSVASAAQRPAHSVGVTSMS